MTTLDAQVLLLLLQAFIWIPMVLVASLLFLTLVDLISFRLGTILRYLAFPGVVLHEVCHDLMCRAMGIRVLEHHISLSRRRGVNGGVVVDASQIPSFVHGFLVSLAPLLLLSLILYLLIVFWVFAPMDGVLKIYFAYCLFIGLPPSRADLHLLSSVARRTPRQTVSEVGLVSIPLLMVGGYIWLCVAMQVYFSIWIFVVCLAGGGLLAYSLWRPQRRHRNP